MPPRKMNPVFLIFHEGDTEEAYINFLKQIKPRLPVKLLPRKAILFAPEIKRRIETEKIGPGDKITTFLMYDLDVKDNAKKLAGYKKGSLSEKQKQQLWDNRKLASDRAKRLPEGENPSSSAFRLIDAIEEVNAQNIKELNNKISQNPLS